MGRSLSSAEILDARQENSAAVHTMQIFWMITAENIICLSEDIVLGQHWASVHTSRQALVQQTPHNSPCCCSASNRATDLKREIFFVISLSCTKTIWGILANIPVLCRKSLFFPLLVVCYLSPKRWPQSLVMILLTKTNSMLMAIW